MVVHRHRLLVLSGLPLLACTSSAPEAAVEAAQGPWVVLRGVDPCEHWMARDPASIAMPITWEPCTTDPAPGCQRFEVAKPPEGEYIHFRGVEGVQAAVLRSEWSRGQATHANENPSDPIRIDAYYDEDGRPLLALRTGAGVIDCPLEVEFGRRSAAIVSTNFENMRRGPDLKLADLEYRVVFAGPPTISREWSTRRAVFLASDGLLNVKSGVLDDGRVALFQRDAPQVMLTAPDGAPWRPVRTLAGDLLDAWVVGDHAMLQSGASELRFMPLAAAGEDAVHRAPEREFGALATNGVDEVYWLEAPKFVRDETRDGPALTTIELRAAKLPGRGEALAPRTLARFAHWHYSDLFSGSRPFTASFHSSQLPHVGVGAGGVFVHVARDREDLIILARPQEDRAWAWTVGDGTRTPGPGPEALVWVEREKREPVPEFRSVMFFGERFLALQYGPMGGEVRRYPVASLLVPAAELRL